MPIRFRCPTCTALMSIARRKANVVVTCPKCGEQVVVPTTEPAAVGAGNSYAVAEDRPLFERPDFDSLLERVGVSAPPIPARPSESPAPLATAVEEDVITLSYPAAAGLAAGCVGLVLASFAAGYLLR